MRRKTPLLAVVLGLSTIAFGLAVMSMDRTALLLFHNDLPERFIITEIRINDSLTAFQGQKITDAGQRSFQSGAGFSVEYMGQIEKISVYGVGEQPMQLECQPEGKARSCAYVMGMRRHEGRVKLTCACEDTNDLYSE